MLAAFHVSCPDVPPLPARDLTLGQMRLLLLLLREGPQPMGRIAEVFDLSSTASTGFVARIERHGLVERRHRSDDRRVVECALTEDGTRFLQGMSGMRLDLVRQRLAVLEPDDLTEFGRLLRAHPADPRTARRQPDMIALLRTYLAPYKRALALVVGLLVVQALATLYLPALNGDIINNGVAKGDTTYILQTGMLMLGISAVVVVASIIAVYWGSKTGMSFGRDVRSSIFRKVESFSRAELDTFGTASLITRNTNDVQQVQMVVLLGLNMMIIAPILAVGGIILALRQDVPLSGILIVVLPIMAIIVGTLMYKALPLFQAVQVKVDRVNQVTREALSGIRVIRAFVRTRHEEERFDVANRDLTATSLTGEPDVRGDDPAADGGVQPVERRDPVVRRDPRRQRCRCRSATSSRSCSTSCRSCSR